jgi:hypothetical protein
MTEDDLYWKLMHDGERVSDVARRIWQEHRNPEPPEPTLMDLLRTRRSDNACIGDDASSPHRSPETPSPGLDNGSEGRRRFRNQNLTDRAHLLHGAAACVTSF